mmetsp:Transcript_26414/g.47637  ORF Transcript_26414/g.47637 Transcript_26414/m.47637 type:complete len:252 (+) Transcript_26414:24-779(+)
MAPTSDLDCSEALERTEPSALGESDTVQTFVQRSLKIGECTFHCVPRTYYIDKSDAGVTEAKPCGFYLKKSVVDFRTWWAVEEGVSAQAWELGIRPGMVLASIAGNDCLRHPNAQELLVSSLPTSLELLEIQPTVSLAFESWPFGFGKMAVQQRKDAKEERCVISNVDGCFIRKGVLQGSSVQAINDAFKPTAAEIQSRAERLSPHGSIEILLERPLPLPAREALNPAAFMERMVRPGAVSGRMLRPNLTV